MENFLISKTQINNGEKNDENNYSDGDNKLMHDIRNNKNLDSTSLANINDINYKNKKGETALIYAFKYKSSKELIAYLLKYNANPNIVDNKGKNVLYYAINYYDENKFDLLKKGTIDVNVKVENVTPLIRAIRLGNIDIVNKLIELGAEISVQKQDGYDAFIVAMLSDNFDMLAKFLFPENISYILNNIDDMFNSIQNPETQTKIQVLISKLYFATAERLKHTMVESFHAINEMIDVLAAYTYSENNETKSYIDGYNKLETPLMKAIETKNSGMVDKLIELGADVNAVNKDGHPIIMQLMRAELTNQVIDLLEKLEGLDKIRYDNGKNLLMYALEIDGLYTLVILSKAGIDINDVDDNGDNALFYAVRLNMHENIELLLKNNIDAKHRNNQSATALMYAAQYSVKEVVERLLNAGLNINDTDIKGRNALWYALDSISSNSEKKVMIEYLMKEDIEKNHKDKKGRNILMYAIEISAGEIILNLLCKYNELLYHLDSNNKNILMYAAKNKNKLLLKRYYNDTILSKQIDQKGNSYLDYLNKNKIKLEDIENN